MQRSILALFSIFMGVLLLHSLILFRSISKSSKITNLQEENKPLKIRSIRTIGIKDSQTDKVSKRKGNPLQNLDLSDLKINPDTQVAPKTKVAKALDNLEIKGPGIKEFLKRPTADGRSTTDKKNSQHTMQKPTQRYGQVVESKGKDVSLNNSNVAVNLEVPKGVKLDELNKEELMFYSFQRRSALQYVSAFYNKLQEFERQNPHLQFPMTKEQTRMTGRITYDKEGNIMRIKMLEWTKTQRLQDFFVEVLQEMNSLPNPPKLLIDENGEFSIVYSLVINV